jgi:threonine synthase
MQLLGPMMDEALRRRGERATIVAATSGDTGAAAIEAFKGRDQIDVFVLYPHGRVSDVQRRQMTTVAAENIHVLAVEGTFDDCQTILKGMFAHQALRTRLRLSAVNSINWARIVAQVVYYFVAAVVLGAPHRAVSFAVPTGNFGDVLAGYVAKRMGLPVDRLMIATNSNDILARTLATGVYEVQSVHATQSPSMDIQVSSNFERALFEASGRDSAAILRHMENLRQSGRFELSAHELAAIRADFDAGGVDEDSTTREIGRTFANTGYLIDPHTAVGVHVARQGLARAPATPMVVLGTAHPAKFGAAVERATGRLPALPARLAGLMDLPERFSILPSDARTIEAFIAARARAGTETGTSA